MATACAQCIFPPILHNLHVQRRNAATRPSQPYPWTADKGPAAGGSKVGRNEPCPCGNGQKYKRCCLSKPRGPFKPLDFATPAGVPYHGGKQQLGFTDVWRGLPPEIVVFSGDEPRLARPRTELPSIRRPAPDHSPELTSPSLKYTVFFSNVKGNCRSMRGDRMWLYSTILLRARLGPQPDVHFGRSRCPPPRGTPAPGRESRYRSRRSPRTHSAPRESVNRP